MATIFYTPTIDFHKLRQRPQQLLSVAAKNGHKVIYCNMTVEEGRRAEEVEPNLFVYHNPMQAIKRNPEIDILYFTWANTLNYIDLIKPKLSIFDNVDNFAEFEVADKRAIQVADIVLVASEPLYNLRKETRPDIYLVRNGCTSKPQIKHEKPSAYDCQKVVLFTGAIGQWVDVELMEKIAKEHVLYVVGEPFGKPLPRGVRFINSVSHDKLMPFIQHADCCILPFDNSNVAKYSCPIKTYEYLQFGKPVVSTDIPESRYLANDWPVFVSKTHDEFLLNIHRALNLNNNPQTENFINEHSWDARWKDIERIIGMRRE